MAGGLQNDHDYITPYLHDPLKHDRRFSSEEVNALSLPLEFRLAGICFGP